MEKQENLQQEALALEALEEISGGSLVGDKAKKYLEDARKFVGDHPYAVGAAAATLFAVGGGEIYKKGHLIRDALALIRKDSSGDEEKSSGKKPTIEDYANKGIYKGTFDDAKKKYTVTPQGSFEI